MFLKNKKKGFTLVEVLLAISILIIIYIGATTAQISSEVFLKNIRADFEKHLELNNALDHMVKNIRQGSQILSISPNSLRFRMHYYDPVSGDQVPPDFLVAYTWDSGQNRIVYEKRRGGVRESETIAKNAKVTFSQAPPGTKEGIKINVEEITSDPDKIKIVVISQAYLYD